MQRDLYDAGDGRLFGVMNSIGGTQYKVGYTKNKGVGWHSVRTMPWRTSYEEASLDLEAYAKRKGYSKYEGEI